MLNKLLSILAGKFAKEEKETEIDEIYNRLKRNKENILAQKIKTDYVLLPEDLNISKDTYIKKGKILDEIMIGEFDQDGFIKSKVQELEGLPIISEDKYMPRKRFEINLVVNKGIVGVKKHYGNDLMGFVNEIEILYELNKLDINVPQILNVDFENYAITMSYLKGVNLRTEIAEKGAIILDSQIKTLSELNLFKRIKITDEIRKEGKKKLLEVIDVDFIQRLREILELIHSNGIVIRDIKYGNIMLLKDNREPGLIDFELSMKFDDLDSWRFKTLKKRDEEKFNDFFVNKNLE